MNLGNIILSGRSQSQKPCKLHEMSRLGKNTERERILGMSRPEGLGKNSEGLTVHRVSFGLMRRSEID